MPAKHTHTKLATPSFISARRKAAEGKRRVKTEEEELAGRFPLFSTYVWGHIVWIQVQWWP